MVRTRIKESQADLFADRTSTATMMANQLRLWFSSFAYVLICAVRRIGLKHTQFAEATAGMIRLKLFKIGAPDQIRASHRLPVCQRMAPRRLRSRPRGSCVTRRRNAPRTRHPVLKPLEITSPQTIRIHPRKTAQRTRAPLAHRRSKRPTTWRRLRNSG
ncbi:hypothetical protein GGD83_004634 [Rhodoblastus sphagnicola]|nr:hypothetical protein [Rhodoblastus sphagnicola]